MPKCPRSSGPLRKELGRLRIHRTINSSLDARGADEGADHLGILDAGRALHAGGNIDAAGAGDANGLRDIAGMKPARDHERQFEIEIFQHMPVEHRAEPAGTGGILRRAGIEQDAIGNRGIAGQRREIGCGLDRDRLHDRQSEFLLDVAQPRHGFLAVQLQHVRLQRLDDIGERRVVGIDGQRDLGGAALGLPAEFARRLEAEMPRRRRKEHESHHVRAGLQRDVERLARGQAANFDDQGHGLSRRGSRRDRRVETELTGRVLQRRALLVSPGGPVNAALRRRRKPLRIAPRDCRRGAQIGQLRPRLARIGLVLARRAAPVALPEPGRRCRPPPRPGSPPR